MKKIDVTSLVIVILSALAMAYCIHDVNQQAKLEHNTVKAMATVTEYGYVYEDGSFHPTWGNPADVGMELGSTVEIRQDGTVVAFINGEEVKF